MRPEARNTLLTALAQQSVNDADSAAWILDKNPEDVCEERMPWDELCNMAYNLAAGFTTLRKAINAILADPTRNCDVGTAAEQEARMRKFCDAHGHGFDGNVTYACESCKLLPVDYCQLHWAQLAYEEGDAK